MMRVLLVGLVLLLAVTHVQALVVDRFSPFIQHHMSDVRICYVRALRLRPDLAGRVAVRFDVDATGAVSAARVTEDTVGDRSMAECVLAAVRGWTFPAAHGADVETVEYPFAFAL